MGTPSLTPPYEPAFVHELVEQAKGFNPIKARLGTDARIRQRLLFRELQYKRTKIRRRKPECRGGIDSASKDVRRAASFAQLL
jgi:hypothetical protein